jgi:ribonuclease-3
MNDLQSRIGHTFTNPDLLRQALTHRSLGSMHNQRLEFLGDAVLGMLIAEMLYNAFPNEAEGDLSRRLVSLVNGEQLADIARELELGALLNLSMSEEEQGGRANPSNLEDAVEALLGAVYLDGGVEAARGLIQRYWSARAVAMASPPKDAKTSLQEWAQGRGLPLPEYAVISADGPSHAPLFVIEARVQGLAPVRAEAGTKRMAERLAAQAMLQAIG